MNKRTVAKIERLQAELARAKAAHESCPYGTLGMMNWRMLCAAERNLNKALAK